MKHQISIIIPVLNEELIIGKLLTHLKENASCSNIAEILVVDGASTDKTIDIVNTFVTSSNSNQSKELHQEADSNVLYTKSSIENSTRTDVTIISSKKGRAKQMNLGAKQATGNILYFLHADSIPPKNFDQLLINEVQKANLAGCFRMQFDNNHWWLRLASWLTQFRWRACRGGDQSQFITKDLFNQIGGFDETYTIYEDNILINELYKRNEFIVINEKIKTSSRLYKKHGVWKLQYHFWTIYVKKWFGASPDELYTYYKKHIN